MKEFIVSMRGRLLLAVLGGMAAAFIMFVGIRFIGQPDTTVHYHANFAIFINGQRYELKSRQYYQEVASCNAHDTPQGRVHLHDNNQDIVHVHDKLVTWSALFNVIGWSLNDRVLSDGTKAYVDGQGSNLHFILNGQPVLSLANEVIGDKDRLLISFGNEDEAALQQQYEQVAANAEKFNATKDPAACRGPEETSAWTRLRKAIWY